MKNFFRLSGVIALTAVIGFSLLACGGGGGSRTPGTVPDTPNVPEQLSSTYAWDDDDGIHRFELTITEPQKKALVFPGSRNLILAGTYVLNVYLIQNGDLVATSSGTASTTGMTVTFTPASSGTQSITGTFTLIIDNTAGDAADITFVDEVTITVADGEDIVIEAGEVFEGHVSSISLDITGTHTFTSAAQGYAAQTPSTVTVTNNSFKATGALAIALSGENAGSFILSAATLASIPVEETRIFTVRPNTGLSAGTYNATVTVSGNDIADSRTFNVSFTVNEASGGGGNCEICGAANTPGLAYTSNYNNTEYRVSGGTVTTGLVCIPAEYNGRPVTEIASNAFQIDQVS